MPRSFSSGIAVAFGGLLLLSACINHKVTVLGRLPAKGPLTVIVTCDSAVTIGLTDAAGGQAWAYEAKPKDTVEWKVGKSVTDIQILPKDSSKALPLDSLPSGRGSGKPATSTVKAAADTGVYAYKIIATCQPTDTKKLPVKVIIDPDMIIVP